MAVCNFQVGLVADVWLDDLQPETTVVTEDEPTLLTARNDGMLNSFNPVQLSAWRANVDMQYIVSRR